MLKNDIAALAPMPDDPILGLVSLYQADERPNKVNLGVGVYLNEAGKVPLLEVVEEAERRMTNRHQPRTYMPMSGLPAYCQARFRQGSSGSCRRHDCHCPDAGRHRRTAAGRRVCASVPGHPGIRRIGSDLGQSHCDFQG